MPMNPWHVATAAEAIAAAQFARLGFDVSVQYGANQPEYDLIVSDGDRLLKVSVKGTQEKGWGLSASYVEGANYHAAADTWLARHKPKTILCFVQFMNKGLNELPSVYLATPFEVAAMLKASRNGHGYSALREHHRWGSTSICPGHVDQIPASWRFSRDRVEHLLSEAAAANIENASSAYRPLPGGKRKAEAIRVTGVPSRPFYAQIAFSL